MMVRRINLVPTTERARTKTDVGLLGIIVAAVVVVGLVLLTYFYFNGSLSTKQDELAQLQAQNAQLQSQLASLSSYEALALEREQTEALVQQVYAGRTLVSDILGDLSLVVPTNVWFTDISLTAPDTPVIAVPGSSSTKTSAAKASAVLGDLAVNGNTYSFEDVATFMVRLELIPGIKKVVLDSAGEPSGSSDPTKDVRGFSTTSIVVNTQDPEAPLPLTPVEVSGQ